MWWGELSIWKPADLLGLSTQHNEMVWKTKNIRVAKSSLLYQCFDDQSRQRRKITSLLRIFRKGVVSGWASAAKDYIGSHSFIAKNTSLGLFWAQALTQATSKWTFSQKYPFFVFIKVIWWTNKELGNNWEHCKVIKTNCNWDCLWVPDSKGKNGLYIFLKMKQWEAGRIPQHQI